MKLQSIEELNVLLRTMPALRIAFDIALADDYEEWVREVNKGVDLCLRRMAQNPELRNAKSEDELTIELVSHLKMMEVDADHDTKVGGHVDIKIKGPNDYHWLAEAKKHKQDYAWIFQGFQQLSTRYSTGLAGQDCGGLIVYSTFARIDNLMSNWKSHLENSVEGLQTTACPDNDLSFVSSHTHEKTGRALKVRHIPLSIYFDPKDRK